MQVHLLVCEKNADSDSLVFTETTAFAAEHLEKQLSV